MTEEQIITIATNMANSYMANKTTMSGGEYTAEYLNYLDYAIKKTREYAQFYNNEYCQESEAALSFK